MPRVLTVEEAVQSLELLRAIVGEKVELDNRGFGLCPFHDEETPSFNIFKAASGRARYHCFGCGAAGDIFNYLQKIEGLKFRSALLRLSNVTRTKLPSSEHLSEPAKSLRAISCDCFFYCRNYTDLRSDYEFLLQENIELRRRLGIPPGKSVEVVQ